MASELTTCCEVFRNAEVNAIGLDEVKRQEVREDSSVRGLELLQILTLAIRTDMDNNLLQAPPTHVGVLFKDVSESFIDDFIRDYQEPYTDVEDGRPLLLREALNKIAHVKLKHRGYRATEEYHELLLVGTKGKRHWIAVLSLIDLTDVVMQLPDRELPGS